MFPFAETFEGLCAAGAVLYLRKERRSFWIWFIPFLALTLATELIGKYIVRSLHRNNIMLYNMYLLLDIAFVTWILYKCFPGKRNWRIPFSISFIALTAIYVSESILHRGQQYNNTTDTVSSFVFVFACGLYYFLLLRDDQYRDLLKFPSFWIVTGLFLFNFGSMVIDLFPSELMNLYLAEKISLRYAIIVFLMAILYGCWIYAFRCRYQETISF